MKKLLVVDGNSLMNRAFYGGGAQTQLSSKKGVPTFALHTFMTMLLRYLDESQATRLLVVFDRPEPTFRHQAYENYKAGRSSMPEDLKLQFPLLKTLLDQLGIKRMDLAGYEADDLIGTYSRLAMQQGFDCDILSGDRDVLQLLTDRCRVLYPSTKGGRSRVIEYTPALFAEDYGITVEQFVDYKALVGDKSDQIPGVKGIGEKSARELLQAYGSLEGIYEHLDELKPRQKLLFETHREDALLSLDLSRISTEVPLPEADCSVEDFVFAPTADTARAQAALSFCEELGLKQVIQRLNLQLDEVPVKPEVALPTVKLKDYVLNEKAEDEESVVASFTQAVAEGQRLYLFCTEQLLPSKQKAVLNERRIFLWADSTAKVRGRSTTDASKLPELNSTVSVLQFDESLWEKGGGLEKLLDALYKALPSAVQIYSYRSKQFWTKKLLDQDYALQDIESLAYVVAKYGERADLYRLVEAVLEEDFGLEENLEDEAALTKALSILVANLTLAVDKLEAELDGARRQLLDTVDLPLCAVLGRMEAKGFLVDAIELDRLHEAFQKEQGELEERIYLQAGGQFNLNSPQQLSEVLYENLNLPSGKKKKNAYSTDQTELQRLLPYHPVVQDIIDYRMVSKLDSTFVKGLSTCIDAKTGRIHSQFRQNLTSTGRLSSNKPNLQNIPTRQAYGKLIRRTFVAEEGKVLLDADYSQIELRLLAHLAQDEAMICAFREGQDIHQQTAMALFGKPADLISASERSVAKTVNFSIVYGISAFSLAQDLSCSLKEAKAYIDRYHSLYPAVQVYMTRQIEQAKSSGYVETLYGRRRYVPELLSKNFNLRAFGERVAMNSPVQGTAADLMRMAMVRVDALYRQHRLEAYLISQVHDELIVEVQQDQAEQAKALLLEAMQSVAELSVPLVADCAMGLNWAEAKD